MSKQLESVLIVPDVHRPYHDKQAWKLVMNVAKALKPQGIIVLGDFGDMYSVSSFSKDPKRALKLDWEVKDCNAGLDELDALGAKWKIYIAGNHEQRLQRYLQDKAPALYPFIKIEQIMRLNERGWKFVPYKSDIKVGRVYFTHDVSYAGRNAVFRTLDAYQHSVVIGHTHRMAYVVEGDATGRAIISCQFGWLGDVKQVDYMHRLKASKDWALGFGIGYLEPKTGLLFITPVPLVNYKCVVSGELYTL